MRSGVLDRRKVMGRLLEGRGEIIVTTGLGATAWDLASLSDSPLDFPLWGAMGGAAMFGLGLALAQPERRVVVFTGDGEALMGLGALSTIAVARPAHLSIVVLDNERYGETGSQRTHTASGVDLEGVARACGFPHAVTVTTYEQVDELRSDLHRVAGPHVAGPHVAGPHVAGPHVAGPHVADPHVAGPLLAVVKVALTPDPMTLPPRDGTFLKNRMRAALLGPGAIFE